MSRTHQRKKSRTEIVAKAIQDKAFEMNLVMLDEQAEAFARAAIAAMELMR
jgi:hypothetical protein